MRGSKQREERLTAGYSGRIFLVLSVGWVGVQIGRQILPPLLPAIIDDLAITPFLAGVGLTALWATYALLHYPAGRLADTLSRKTILISGHLILAAGFFMLSTAVVYSMFVASVMIIGIGAAFYFISMRLLVADLFVEKRAQAFGVQMAFGQLGSTLAAAVAVIVLAFLTWRGGFVPLGVFLLVIALVLHFWIDEPYVIRSVELGLRETGSRVFGSALIRRALIAYVLIIFTWQGALGFLPTFLQIEKGFSPALASAGFALVFIVGMVIGPVAGVLGDRYSKITVAASGVLVAAGGLFLLTQAESVGVIAVSIIVFAVGLMAFPPVMQAYLLDTFADASMGGDFGAFKTVYSGIGSLGPSYVGFVAGVASYTVAYLGLTMCLLLGLAASATIWRSRGA